MALIALPCAIGLAVMAEPIIRLLCPGYSETSVAVATPILQVFGIAVICNSMVLLLNAIMQAHGDVTTPVVNMLIGGVVKVIVNYFLVAVPSLNIVGAAIGTLTCYAVITALDLVAIRRRISTKPRVLRNMLRPALAAVLMGAVTFGAYRLAGRILSPKIACLLALVIAVGLLCGAGGFAALHHRIRTASCCPRAKKSRRSCICAKKVEKNPCERGQIMIDFISKRPLLLMKIWCSLVQSAHAQPGRLPMGRRAGRIESIRRNVSWRRHTEVCEAFDRERCPP